MSTKLSEMEKRLRELEDSIRETMILAADLPQDNIVHGSPKGVMLICLREARRSVRDAIENVDSYIIRLDLLQQAIMLSTPRITHSDIERELRKVLAHDPMKAGRAVGTMYGYAFRKAESDYVKRGSRGRQDWSGVPIGGLKT